MIYVDTVLQKKRNLLNERMKTVTNKVGKVLTNFTGGRN